MNVITDRAHRHCSARTEAIVRLSRTTSLAARDAFVRSSAEVAQFYDVTTTADKIALQMRDEIFSTHASLEEPRRGSDGRWDGGIAPAAATV